MDTLEEPQPPSMTLTDRAMYLALVLAVLAGYVPTLFMLTEPLTSPPVLAMIALGAIFIFIGITVFEWIARQDRLSLFIGYYLVQLAIATAAVHIIPESGNLWLMALPLVGQAVTTLPRRWLILFAVLVVAAFVIPGAFLYGWGNALATVLGYTAGVFFVIIFTQVYVNELKARTEIQHLAARLEEMNRQLGAYAVQAEELATTKERNRLAREIHDSLGHFLTVVNVQLEAAQAVFESDPDAARNALAKAQTLTKEGLDEVRRSVAALRASPMDGQPLEAAFETLLEKSRAAGLLAEMRVSGRVRALTPQVEHTLYRAAQEGLTNVHKHARASKVTLHLDYSAADGVSLLIEDNGVGLDPEVLEEGFGVLGLRERVKILGGKLLMTSEHAQGTRLEVRIPT
jgi:signal transduction histidine kinase